MLKSLNRKVDTFTEGEDKELRSLTQKNPANQLDNITQRINDYFA